MITMFNMDCSAENHDQDGDSDDSETKPLEVPLDNGTQNTEELVCRVVDSSKVQMISKYVD
jgi:hypothetical protein